MQIKRCMLFLLSCLIMQSCASTMQTEHLESGKRSFMAGDFKSAFHQLLPLAAEGNPQAEYGVGYMYYYGYGVTQDTESGIFWMNRAASAHYAPAIKALAAIRENNIEQARKRRYAPNESAPPRINTTHAENTVTGKKIESDEVIEALNTLPAPQPGHVTVMTQPDQTDQTALAKTEPPALKKMNNEPVIKPVAGFNSKKYTLQLLGSYYLSSVKARQAQLNLGTPTYIGQTKHNGRDWYILSVGQYPALGNAELAKLDLPQKIKDFKPWIRKCDELRWVG